MTPQTILITGATSGIGRHAALALATRGHRVFATGRRVEQLRALEVESGGRIEGLRVDVTDSASIDDLRAEVLRRTAGNGVDVLVNNAGYGQLGAVLDIDDAAVRAQFETNVFGLLTMSRAFTPDMIRRGKGRVIQVSSVGGRTTLPLFGVYNSTKYAVESLSDAMRVELARYGVDVVILEPGAINTGFNETASGTVTGGGLWDDTMRAWLGLMKRVEGRAATPDVTTRALIRAVEASRPKARYVAPWSEGFALGVLRALPTRWSDALFARVLGLHRRPTAPALPASVAA
jgi:NAD(P)-dependent dehydrogenase (short-subunit alcohol dehydrogenase family)